LVFFNDETQKIIISANISSGERILAFRLCLSWYLKWTFHIDTMWEAIGIVFETILGLGSAMGLPLKTALGLV